MSTYIRRALDIFHIYPDRVAISWFILTLRSRFGQGILAKSVITEIQNSQKKLYVINGIRKKSEVPLLRKKFGKNFVLVDVFCEDKVRYERIKLRQKKTGIKKDAVDLSLKEFLKWEQRIGNEKEIPAIEKKADYKIDNNGTKSALFLQVNTLLREKIKIKK